MQRRKTKCYVGFFNLFKLIMSVLEVAQLQVKMKMKLILFQWLLLLLMLLLLPSASTGIDGERGDADVMHFKIGLLAPWNGTFQAVV